MALTSGYHYTATYQIYDRYSENPQGFANIRVYEDETNLLLGEVQSYFTIGTQSVEQIQQSIESAAQDLINEYLNHPLHSAMFSVLALSTATEETNVDFTPVLDAIDEHTHDYSPDFDSIEDAITALENRPVTVSNLEAIYILVQAIQSGISAISGLQQTATERTENIYTKQGELKTALDQINVQTTLDDDFAQLSSELDTLSSTLSSLANESVTTRTTTQSNATILASITTAVTAIQEALSTLQSTVATDVALLTDIRDRTSAIQDNDSEIEGTLDAFDTSLDTIITNHAELLNNIADLTTKINGIVSDISDIRSQQASSQTALNGFTDSIAAIDVNLGGIHNTTDALNGRLDALEAKLDTIIDLLTPPEV